MRVLVTFTFEEIIPGRWGENVFFSFEYKGVVSSNTGGSDETPTLVSTGVPHRQRSQGGAVWTIIADRQNGSGVGYLRKR